MEFFVLPDKRAKLTAASRLYELYQPEDEINKCIIDLVKYTLIDIIENGEFYDENGRYIIEKYGKRLISSLPHSVKDISEEAGEDTFLILHRLICEIEFTTDVGINQKIIEPYQHINHNIAKLNHNIQHHIIYAKYEIPSYLLNRMHQSEQIKYALRFEKNLQQFKEIKEESDRALTEQWLKIEELKDQLNDHNRAFNFILIDESFYHLHRIKTKEKHQLEAAMLTTITTLLGFFIYAGLSTRDVISDGIIDYTFLAIHAAPNAAAGVFLLYLFRVALKYYLSNKKILFQIEMRMTLCHFMMSYQKNANSMAGIDKSTQEKFENLIFSNIIINDEPPSSVLDGVEQISKIINTIKSNGK